MRSFFLAPALAGLVAALPAPQDIDFDLVDALPNPTYTQAVGQTAQIVTYDATTVYNAALPQITSDPSDDDGTATVVHAKRAVACASQPVGYGPVPSPDTVSAFLAQPEISNAAVSAPIPTGYVQQYSNLQAASNAYGYLGYITLKTYDSNACAAKCNTMNGCISFNIYFERDPTLEPGSGDSGCSNPPSTTMIKCSFWGGPVSTSDAVNKGQWRNKFQVAIGGSNGYTNSTVASVPGYKPATYLGNAAINAPFDKFGYDSYMGVAMFIGTFDARLCAKACSDKSAYNLAHPPTDGTPVQTCQFFNTYILYINTTSNVQGQYCAMYSESWDKSYATNVGQWRGSDNYKIQYSFSYSNLTNPGAPDSVAAAYQARNDVLWPANSAQPYCSSILGYTTPVVYTTTTATSTPLTTTTTATTQIDLTTTTVSFPTTTTVSTTTTVTPLKKRDDADFEPTLIVSDGITAMALPTLEPVVEARKRDIIAMPQVLSKYPASILTSGCSLAVSPVTVTSTITSTTTTTVPTVTSTTITSTTTTSTSTTVTVPVVTTTVVSTTTAQPAAPVATPYRFKVVGGTYAGQYLAFTDPKSKPNQATYGLVYADATNQAPTTWLRQPDGTISDSSSAIRWVSTHGQSFDSWYVLAMDDFSRKYYKWYTMSCTVQASAAVTSAVPGAAGALVCKTDTGTTVTHASCKTQRSGGLTDLWQTPDLSSLPKGWDCEAMTIAAIPVS